MHYETNAVYMYVRQTENTCHRKKKEDKMNIFVAELLDCMKVRPTSRVASQYTTKADLSELLWLDCFTHVLLYLIATLYTGRHYLLNPYNYTYVVFVMHSQYTRLLLY